VQNFCVRGVSRILLRVQPSSSPLRFSSNDRQMITKMLQVLNFVYIMYFALFLGKKKPKIAAQCKTIFASYKETMDNISSFLLFYLTIYTL
jgi:hypothetical protein